MDEKIKHIPKRVIALKANVDCRTVCKFLSNEKILYSKEISIKKAIKEIINDEELYKIN